MKTKEEKIKEEVLQKSIQETNDWYDSSENPDIDADEYQEMLTSKIFEKARSLGIKLGREEVMKSLGFDTKDGKTTTGLTFGEAYWNIRQKTLSDVEKMIDSVSWDGNKEIDYKELKQEIQKIKGVP